MSGKNGKARRVGRDGATASPPAIAPPGKVRAAGHGMPAPLAPAAGMDRLREVLGLSRDASVTEVANAATGEIEGLRTRLAEARTTAERSKK